jgi:hypothetical protein
MTPGDASAPRFISQQSSHIDSRLMTDGMRIMNLIDSLPHSSLQRFEVRGCRVVPLTGAVASLGTTPPAALWKLSRRSERTGGQATAIHVIIQAYAQSEHSNQTRRTQGAR